MVAFNSHLRDRETYGGGLQRRQTSVSKQLQRSHIGGIGSFTVVEGLIQIALAVVLACSGENISMVVTLTRAKVKVEDKGEGEDGDSSGNMAVASRRRPCRQVQP